MFLGKIENEPRPVDLSPIVSLCIDDLSSLMQLEQQAFPIDQWPEEAMRLMFSIYPSDSFYGVKDKGRVVAYVFVESIADGVGGVGSIAVDEAYRGYGLGRKLLLHSIDQLRAKQTKVVVLQTRVTNIPMQNLAQQLGFHMSGKIPSYYCDGADAYEMMLELA